MLKLEHISYGVPDRPDILVDVNLEIDEPFVAITGPNGSGRHPHESHLRHHPAQQRPHLFQRPGYHRLVHHRSRQSRHQLCVPEASCVKGLKVIDLLTLASGKGTNLSEACDYLSEVGLCARDYIDRELNDSLSGGEMKHIQIAMMLARSTALSLFDEPEAGIDLWSFQSLIQVFEKMNEKTNGKILIISHQERILNIADRIIMMQDGRIVRDGKPDDVMPYIIGSGCTKIMDKLAK